MKAISVHSFGQPNVLVCRDLPKPSVGPGQLLIRMQAAGVNPVDDFIRSGNFDRFLPALPYTPGRDIAGIIEELGAGVTGWSRGEEVFGMLPYEQGSYAEYVVASAHEMARIPEGLDPKIFAALPLPALTAWQGLFECGELKPGQRVLIHGAGGGVGHLAVQFAMQAGAEVFATAHPLHLGILQNLGLQNVLDFTTQRFEDHVPKVHVVLDTLGGEIKRASWQTLLPGGFMVCTHSIKVHPEGVHPEGSLPGVAQVEKETLLPYDPPRPPLATPADQMHLREVVVRPDVSQLNTIAQMVKDGKVKVLIAKDFPMMHASDAHTYLHRSDRYGRIVLTA